MEVQLGSRTATFPSKDLEKLEPCNHLLGKKSATKQYLEENGYTNAEPLMLIRTNRYLSDQRKYVTALQFLAFFNNATFLIISITVTYRVCNINFRNPQTSNQLLEWFTIYSRIFSDGSQIKRSCFIRYLFIKNFHDRDDVLKARSKVLDYIQNQGENILNTTSYSLEEGVLNEKCGLGCLPFMEGKSQITQCEEIKRVIEGEHAFRFFENLFEEEACTFDYKWLRAMHRNGYTGVHVDRVYMSRGSQSLLTMWTPLGDISVDMGVLAVCEGSHIIKGFKRFQETYGNCDLEKENVVGTGWFTEDPKELSSMGGVWKTTNFEAGDVIIFNIRLAHMSTANLTSLVRLSCDTRWQPKSHKIDSRFAGDLEHADPKFGVHAVNQKMKEDFYQTTIETLKRKWGFNTEYLKY